MNNSIVLVNPPVRLDRSIVQPLGLASVAGRLRNSGYSDVRIIDGCRLVKKYGYDETLRIIRQEIEKIRPFIVGCTLHSSAVEEAEKICEEAFRVNAHVVIGGHGATANHEASAVDLYRRAADCRASSVTAVVRGEGEETAGELFNVLLRQESLHGIRGVTFFDGEKVVVNSDRPLLDINSLAPPAMDLLQPVSEYGGWFNIEESRGCIFHCAFCSIRDMYPVVRLKDPGRIGIEVEQAKRLGAAKVYLTGELTLFETGRAVAIAGIMKRFGMKWSTGAHPSLIRKAAGILRVLRDSGLICLEIGIEAGSQRSLAVFNKGTTPEMNRLAIWRLEKAGIPQWLHFIPFHPFMNMRDLYSNIMFMTANLSNFLGRPNYPDYLSHAWIPVEGTPLYRRARDEGLLPKGGAGPSVRYEDRRVLATKESYDRWFLEEFGEEYYRYHRELVAMTGVGNIDDLVGDNRFMLIGTLPLAALTIAYTCAISGIPAKKHLRYLSSCFFEALSSGDESVSYKDIVDDVLERIDRA